MSKLKARITMGGVVRVVEIDRRAPSIAVLKSGAQKKYKLPNTESTLAYQIPNGPKIALKTDDDLKRAIAESVKARSKFVEIEIGGRPPAAVAQPQQQQQQQQHTSAPPAKSGQPAHSGGGHAAPSHAGPAAAGGAITFQLPGGGTSPKAQITPQPEATRYTFVPTLAVQPTTVEIEIPSSRQLQFKMSSSTSKFTQTFNLPFDISLKDLMIQGTTVILTFPF